MAILDDLARRQLVIVTGKGGVGKSAVAAALGRLLSRRGRRTLILEIDPRESVHQMVGLAPSGGEIVEASSGLYLQNLQPRRVLDDVVRRQVRIERLAERILNSTVYQHFAEGAPGFKELAVLGYSVILVRGMVKSAPPIDVVILDAPATGHGVSLLAAPGLVAEVIRHGPFAHMTGEVAGVVADPRRSAVVVVTVAEEMPVSEALELRRMLAERLSREPELLVINGLYPPVVGGGSRGADEATRLWGERRRVNEVELGRLAERWSGERAELPLLPLDRGPDLIAALESRLEAQSA